MSERLRSEIVERIGREGPITFASFMETALYDELDGFYAQPPVGPAAHFVTSPHVSPAFGDLVARQIAECWDLLDRPGSFDVVELGAGDGTLARQIRKALGAAPDLAASVRYIAVERSPGALASLRGAGLETARELPGSIEGCVLANELLDNLPFHRLREREGKIVEVRVGTKGDALVEVESEPATEALEALGKPLRTGEERPVSPASIGLIRQIAASLDRGYAFFFDYGFTAEELPGPVHAYREHGVLADVLEDPGSRDVTAAVDMDVLAGEAAAGGLEVWGPVPQRDALLALGFRLWSSGVRARQADAQERGDWREANRLFAERSSASLLVDEKQLGSLRLLAMGTRGLPAPASILGDRETGC